MQLRRGDVVVFSISAVLAAIVVVGVAFSLLVVDRWPRSSLNQPAPSSSSLLVMTWGPSLCEVDPSNPGCTTGHVGKLGRTLILHGLWPQPRSEEFCGVSKVIAERARNLHDADMPSLDLPQEVRSGLQSVMSDAALLAPHEWYTHGTCSGLTPAAYFTGAISLADQASDVLNPLFAKAEHGKLSLWTVRDRIDAEFGEGAGKRVGLSCHEVNGEQIIVYEVHLSLPPISEFGTAANALSLGDLLAKGPTTSAGCWRGAVP